MSAAIKNKRNFTEDNQQVGGKADWRKYAKICSANGCTTLARKGQKCIRHGATWTKKRCSSEGCTNQARRGGVCARHGAKVKRCSYEGCTNRAQKGGVCKKHGAKLKLCCHEGCTNLARRGGVCWRHGANCTPYDGSTAFGSEYEKTTATLTLAISSLLTIPRKR